MPSSEMACFFAEKRTGGRPLSLSAGRERRCRGEPCRKQRNDLPRRAAAQCGHTARRLFSRPLATSRYASVQVRAFFLESLPTKIAHNRPFSLLKAQKTRCGAPSLPGPPLPDFPMVLFRSVQHGAATEGCSIHASEAAGVRQRQGQEKIHKTAMLRSNNDPSWTVRPGRAWRAGGVRWHRPARPSDDTGAALHGGEVPGRGC